MTTIGILAALYFLPSMIAITRYHPYVGAIIVVDLFLGWTLVGWVAALAWAVFPIQRKAAAGK